MEVKGVSDSKEEENEIGYKMKSIQKRLSKTENDNLETQIREVMRPERSRETRKTTRNPINVKSMCD